MHRYAVTTYSSDILETKLCCECHHIFIRPHVDSRVTNKYAPLI